MDFPNISNISNISMDVVVDNIIPYLALAEQRYLADFNQNISSNYQLEIQKIQSKIKQFEGDYNTLRHLLIHILDSNNLEVILDISQDKDILEILTRGCILEGYEHYVAILPTSPIFIAKFIQELLGSAESTDKHLRSMLVIIRDRLDVVMLLDHVDLTSILVKTARSHDDTMVHIAIDSIENVLQNHHFIGNEWYKVGRRNQINAIQQMFIDHS